MNPPSRDSGPPVDRIITDESGELDLEQIRYNLSLTVEERIKQHMRWLQFVEIAREAGRRHYGMDTRPPETTE